ncbi:hypothetical protein M3Y97_01098400 [Aphelenchoides bicaudatus]|nr:hypothetical protein M3Y97_01098400 [Aphelenchoides bicaudatus]
MNESQKITVYAGTHKTKLLVNASYKVSDLISILERETSIPAEELNLIYKDHELKLDTTVKNLGDGAVLFLKGVLDLHFHVSNERTHILFVIDLWQINTLCQIIADKLGIDMNNKHFMLGGLKLHMTPAFRLLSICADMNSTFEYAKIKMGAGLLIINDQH